MPAFVVVDVDVTDPDAYAVYRDKAGPAVEANGGRYVARGGTVEALEGDWAPSRLVILEFPDLEAAKRWYDSPEYRDARAAREGAAEMRMVATEGLPG